MRLAPLIALLLVLFAFARPVHAQSDPSHAAAARVLFREGVALARAGDYAEAVDRFRRAQALRPSPPVAYNLASALVHQGELVEGSEVLAFVLRDGTVTDAIRAQATRLQEELAPRLAHLTLRTEGDPSGVRVELDQRELPDAGLGVPIPVDPGTHEVRAVRGEHELTRERVELAEGERRTVTLSVATLLPAAAALDTPIPEVLEASPTEAQGDDGPWIGLGVGLGVLAAAAIVVVIVVVTQPGAPSPVSGNTMPGVLTW